ncbi:MAG TPA: hypothetical protein VF173_15890 [Thermoanaerobaculia bacterium]|nr:hypothetical protein [Thermoanaerobaculia bacterium]
MKGTKAHIPLISLVALACSSVEMLQPRLSAQSVVYWNQDSFTSDQLYACGLAGLPCTPGIATSRVGAPPSWLAEISDSVRSDPASGLAHGTTQTQAISGSTAGTVSAYVGVNSEWGGHFTATGNLLFLKWELYGAGQHSEQIGIPQLSFESFNSGSIVLPITSQTSYLVGLGGNAASDGFVSDWQPHSNYFGKITDIRQCDTGSGSSGDLLVQESHISSYSVKIWIRCGAGPAWGYRLERALDSAPGLKGWIGGCFYSQAVNEWTSLRDGGFRLFNRGISDGLVDIYTYHPSSDTVTKGRMTAGEYEQELASAAREGREPHLPVQWTGPPPADSESLGAVPLSPSALVASEPAATPLDRMSLTPVAWLSLASRTDKEWRYTLEISGSSGVFIAPGNQIELSSGPSAGGRVEGDAVSVSAGAWRLLRSPEGSLVFEATTYAYLTGSISGFVATGQQESEIPYTTRGDWIGFSSTISGPSPFAIFGDGFESGDASAWSWVSP